MTAVVMLALALAAAPTDQTVQVRKGMRLEVRNFAGDVIVKVWDRDAVRVEAEHSERETVEIRPTDLALIVRTRSRTSQQRSVDYTFTVPSWMPIDIDSTNSDVMLDGVAADVSVETLRGDITVHGGSGLVALKSVQGRISLEQAKGRIQAETLNDGIRMSDVSGDISISTNNGSIVLERMDAANLDAYTINGTISYDGPLKDRGSYRLTTHNGVVSMTVPEKTNATLLVRTYGGSFRSSFPVTIDDQQRRNRFTLTLGDGTARVELESFNGSIALRRPGEPAPQPANRGRSRVGAPNPPSPPNPPAPASPANPPSAPNAPNAPVPPNPNPRPNPRF